MKAIAYYRVSSEEQEKSDSIDLQKVEVKPWLEEKGIELVAEFADNGISGATIEKRPGFQDALSYLENEKKRLEGKFIGGHVPYGVRYDKETATFTLDPVEIATMKKLFELKTAGWGIVKIKDYFDQHPEQFPKRKRKNQKGWYALTMRGMINNDFYFTG